MKKKCEICGDINTVRNHLDYSDHSEIEIGYNQALDDFKEKFNKLKE